jgi:hypothetical protein
MGSVQGSAEMINKGRERHVMRGVEGLNAAAVVIRHGRCLSRRPRPHDDVAALREVEVTQIGLRPWILIRSTMLWAVVVEGHTAASPPDSSSSGPAARSTGKEAVATASDCSRAAA